MNALTPTLTANPLLPPVPRFLADLLYPTEEPRVEEPIAKEPRGGIPQLSYGKRIPEERLTPGYYAVPVRGVFKPGIADYTRLGGLKGP